MYPQRRRHRTLFTFPFSVPYVCRIVKVLNAVVGRFAVEGFETAQTVGVSTAPHKSRNSVPSGHRASHTMTAKPPTVLFEQATRF